MQPRTSKRVAGRLSIVRSIGGEDDTIRVEIRLEQPSARLVIAEVSLADFALCVTGRDVPAQLRLFDRPQPPHEGKDDG